MDLWRGLKLLLMRRGNTPRNYQVQFFTAISSVGHQAAYVVLDKLVALIHTLASPPGYPWRTCQAAWDLATDHGRLGNSSGSDAGPQATSEEIFTPGWPQASLELEKTVNAALLDLHKVAGGHGDAHLTDFLEEHFLGEQASQPLWCKCQCLSSRWRASKRSGTWWRRWRGAAMESGCMSLTRNCKPRLELRWSLLSPLFKSNRNWTKCAFLEVLHNISNLHVICSNEYDFQKMLDHHKALINAEMAAEKVVAQS